MRTLRPPGPSDAAADPMGLVGQTLDGQFRIEAVVGAGGFSVVYRGFHLGLSEPVAIKCLRLQGSLGSAVVESFLRRFRDEGRILYRLSQGNLHIVRSIASGTTVAPVTNALVPYIVLEWLEGRSLAADFDARHAAGQKGRTLEATMALLDSAAGAIAYAHEAGVVHRDLNPGNIFLTETREGMRAKVLDFGIAKVVSDHVLELGPRAPTFGQLRIFSPAYAAPEQLDDRIGKIAPWTDVYTLALVVLEALRDSPAMTGEDLATLYQQTLDPSRRPTPHALGIPVPQAIEEVFARALALDPRERYVDVGEFWSTLKGIYRRTQSSGPPRQTADEELAPDTVRMDLPPGISGAPPAGPPRLSVPTPTTVLDRTLPLAPPLAPPPAPPVAAPPAPPLAPPKMRFEDAAPPASPVGPPPPALYTPPPEAAAPMLPAWSGSSPPRAALPTVPPMTREAPARRWMTIALAVLLGATLAAIGLFFLARWLSSSPPPLRHGSLVTAPETRSAS